MAGAGRLRCVLLALAASGPPAQAAGPPGGLCLQVNCAVTRDPACCSVDRSMARVSPLANFRFGSIFRNAIPPKRDYQPPSFEDIFEKTVEAEGAPEGMQHFDSFAAAAAFPETDRKSESSTVSYFRSQLQQMEERNQQMLFGDRPKISTTQRTTQRPTEMSLTKKREGQYLRAQQKLLQLQRQQASRIKAEQSQSKLLQMVLAKQKELEERRRQKKEEEVKRRQKEEDKAPKRRLEKEVDQTKYQTRFNVREYRREEQRRKEEELRRKVELERLERAEDKARAREEEERRVREEGERLRLRKEREALAVRREEERERARVVEEAARRKAAEAAAYQEKLAMWRSKYQKVALPTGQQFIDKSTETKILGGRRAEETEAETTTLATTTAAAWPAKEEENELENVVVGQVVEQVVGQQLKPRKRKKQKSSGNPFTQEVCERLLVPCRFVTEHPCCQLPQKIELVGRPRAMDGSADLRWRFMQSRGRQAEGRMIGGFGSNRKSVLTQPGTSSFSVKSRGSSIPYSHWTSKEVVAVPIYHYNGGPAVTSTILRQCWRLTYLDCRTEREHPCCSLHSSAPSSPSVLSTNLLDRWLSRS